jgi:exopolyphosphatase/guanosine-5'-triphosphate,3'-diphosphate pyrophosphatase
MAEIIPRWEWRTFGSHFGLAEAAFAAMTSEASTDSEELYFLAPGGANVKIRDDLLDIKELQEVGADGLERWLPIMKAEFPLSRADVAKVVSSLGVPPVAMERDSYTLHQFLDEITTTISGVRAVKVIKHRVRYVVGGCMSEVTDVIVDGRSTRTIAVESEDRPAVVRAVERLGLGGYVNTNYPQGLGAVLDLRPARYAVIDVGTNSVKLNLGERTKDGAWRTLSDRAEVTRLGEGLDKGGTLVPAAIERTAAAIRDMVDEARATGALAIVAVGTAGLRIANNSEEAVAAIKDVAGVSVEIISGQDESRLAYLAVRASLDLGDASLAVFDTGGGSSQFTFGEASSVTDRFSVDVGAVRYTEQFGLDDSVTDTRLLAASVAITGDLSVLDDRSVPDALVGMGGAVTNITAVSCSMAKYDPDAIQGAVLTRKEIDRQIEMYRTMDTSTRRNIVGLQPNRAAVILAGALIVRTIMDKLAQVSMTVSDRGLRHGLTVERFGARLTDRT